MHDAATGDPSNTGRIIGHERYRPTGAIRDNRKAADGFRVFLGGAWHGANA